MLFSITDLQRHIGRLLGRKPGLRKSQLILRLDKESSRLLRGGKRDVLGYGNLSARLQKALDSYTDDDLTRLPLQSGEIVDITSFRTDPATHQRLRILGVTTQRDIKDILIAVIKAYYGTPSQ